MFIVITIFYQYNKPPCLLFFSTTFFNCFGNFFYLSKCTNIALINYNFPYLASCKFQDKGVLYFSLNVQKCELKQINQKPNITLIAALLAAGEIWIYYEPCSVIEV